MHVRVFVIMEGGVIQNVLADDPDIVDVVVVDYDVDGGDPENTTQVPQQWDGKVTDFSPAYVTRWPVNGFDTPTKALEDKADEMFGPGQS